MPLFNLESIRSGDEVFFNQFGDFYGVVLGNGEAGVDEVDFGFDQVEGVSNEVRVEHGPICQIQFFFQFFSQFLFTYLIYLSRNI